MIGTVYVVIWRGIIIWVWDMGKWYSSRMGYVLMDFLALCEFAIGTVYVGINMELIDWVNLLLFKEIETSKAVELQ